MKINPVWLLPGEVRALRDQCYGSMVYAIQGAASDPPTQALEPKFFAAMHMMHLAGCEQIKSEHAGELVTLSVKDAALLVQQLADVVDDPAHAIYVLPAWVDRLRIAIDGKDGDE